MSQSRYEERQARTVDCIRDADLDGILLEDTEGRRCSSIRYLTGLPQDGLLFIFRTGRTVLVPWDIIMAEKMASASNIIPLTSFERKIDKAILGVLEAEGLGTGAKLELPARTPYPMFNKLCEQMPDILFSCPEKGVEYRIMAMRACKDRDETRIIKQAADITNTVLDQLENKFIKGALTTELDAAMFIAQAGRKLGAESMGFETIAAGPERSFGIHAFPSFSEGPIGTTGLSIIDFGFCFEGYTSDVTMTVARGPLTDTQEQMISLVQQAYDAAVEASGPGSNIRGVCGIVDTIFEAAGFAMPHSLGHGVGLDAHEAPMVSTRAEEDAILEPGMVITIEPGLYSRDDGGVRLENDLLITEDGAETLTRSRILRLR